MIPPTIAAAAVATALTIGSYGGYKVAQWRGDAAISKLHRQIAEVAALAEAAARESEQRYARKAHDAAKALAEVEVSERVIVKTVNREVVRYVETPAAGKCVISSDFVRGHDLATGRDLSGDAEAADGIDDPA